MSALDKEWIRLSERLAELHELTDTYDDSWRLSKIHKEIDEITRRLAQLEILLEKRNK